MKRNNESWASVRQLLGVLAACFVALFFGVGAVRPAVAPALTPRFFPSMGIADGQFAGTNWTWTSNEAARAFVTNLSAHLVSPLVDKAYVDAHSAAPGVIILNGLTAANQTFAQGSAGNDFNMLSVGSTHLWNFPLVGTNSNGRLSSNYFVYFSQKVDPATFQSSNAALQAQFAGKQNTSATLTTFLGLSLQPGDVPQVDGTTNWSVLHGGSFGQVLTKTASGTNAWQTVAGGGGGGLLSLNGETGSSQLFGESGFGHFVSGSGVHTYAPSNSAQWLSFLGRGTNLQAYSSKLDNISTQTVAGGYLPIGKTNGSIQMAALTAGSGITVTSGDGSITIAATGGGGGGGGASSSNAVAEVEYREDPTTDGVASTSGSYNNGELNTLVQNDNSIVSLTTNVITIVQPGYYRIIAEKYMYSAGGTRASVRLYNHTAAKTLRTQARYQYPGGIGYNLGPVYLTTTSSNTLIALQYVVATGDSQGQGLSANTGGESNCYSSVSIEQLIKF
ncbi:MAG: hypothetical protein JO317_04440 [Verrucomicrobiae bacterium]|nr:hypothetical protein [Verrucomicrobiae bacterium]